MEIIQLINFDEFLNRLRKTLDSKVDLVNPRVLHLSRSLQWYGNSFNLSIVVTYETYINQQIRLINEIGHLSKDNQEMTTQTLENLDQRTQKLEDFCKIWQLKLIDLDLA